jgi:hypothetical protein
MSKIIQENVIEKRLFQKTGLEGEATEDSINYAAFSMVGAKC